MRLARRLALVLASTLMCLVNLSLAPLAQAQDLPPAGTPSGEPGVPPLALRSSASATRLDPGQEFAYTTEVSSNSPLPRAVELRIGFDPQLEVLGAGGSCSVGAQVICMLSVQRDSSKQLLISLRVRPTAPHGGTLALQALAQDDRQNTAAADNVAVVVSEQPTVEPGASLPARPTLTPTPRQPANAPPVNRPAPTAGQPAAPSEPGAATAQPAPADALAAPLATPIDAADRLDAGGVEAPAPPLLAGAGAALWGDPAQTAPLEAPAAVQPAVDIQSVAVGLVDPAPAPWQGVLLPDTSLVPPAVGFGAGLLMLALVIHGLRRVRRAAARIEHSARAIKRMALLIAATSALRQREGRD